MKLIDIREMLTERQEDSDLTIGRNEILSYTASFSLAEYSKKLETGIFFNPKFQRHYIWDEKRKSRFIESLICDFPIPSIFLYRKPQEEKYLIIDGYQRLSTINSFFNNKFSLIEVMDSLREKKFADLTPDDQESLCNKQISAIIVRQIQPNNENILYSLFERLNTGGQNLNNMEVRRAINFGPLIQTLEKLNLDSNWRLIWGKPAPHHRFLDVELILRVLAFSDLWDNKEKKLLDYSSLKDFLNQYCTRYRDDEKKDFQKLFIQSTKSIIEQLGPNPFTLYSRPNYVLLDSIMTALLLKQTPISNLAVRVKELKANQEFRDIYEAKQGTLSAKSINTRIKLALDYLL